MFGFSFRGLAEAAINTFTGSNKNDVDLENQLQEIKTQESSFSNIISITKEVEKQLMSFIATNSSILRQMEALDDETQKKESSVDIWRTASHFYHSINEAEDQMMSLINDQIMAIRDEITKRSESLHDIEKAVSAYNQGQRSISEDEDLLKQLQFNKESYQAYKNPDQVRINEIEEQISNIVESTTKAKSEQEMKKQSLTTSLKELKEGNETFIETSLSQLYQMFSALYTSMSQVFSSEIPESILSLKQPLIENQPDKVTHINLSAGSTHDHSISMTKGSYVKWLFSCDDGSVRFSVIFTPSLTKESVMIEEEHKVKGDGRYDMGEYTCEEPGVLTLVWDNTYSILTSREVVLRVAVKHPKQEVKEVESEEEAKTEEVKSEADKVEEIKEEVKTEEIKEEVKTEVIKEEVKTEVIKEDIKTEDLKSEVDRVEEVNSNVQNESDTSETKQEAGLENTELA